MNHRVKNHGNHRWIIIVKTLLLLLTTNLCGAQADVSEKSRLPVVEWGFVVPLMKTSVKFEGGFGTRVVFNPHPLLSVEIEADHIAAADRENIRKHPDTGDINEIFAGVKSGHRFDRVGLFAKARPGYLSFTRFISGPRPTQRPRRGAFDLGMVAEFYMTRHWAMRVDAGDTMVFYNAARLPRTLRQDVTHHNLQLLAAIQCRF
jgi:hypothetical protein